MRLGRYTQVGKTRFITLRVIPEPYTLRTFMLWGLFPCSLQNYVSQRCQSCTAALQLRFWWYPYTPHLVPFWYSSTDYDCTFQDKYFTDLILAYCQGCVLLWLQDNEYLGVRRVVAGFNARPRRASLLFLLFYHWQQLVP